MASPKAAQNPTEITELLRRASAHHQRGQLRDAELIYRQVLDRQPQNFDALHLCGVLMHQRGLPAEALKLIGQALKTNARSAAAHANCGVVLAALERPAEALASYERAIALKPDYAEALNSRGNMQMKLGRAADALASYDRALAQKPVYGDALINRASALRLLGRDAEAADSYARVLALNPQHIDALFGLGNTLQALQRFDQALTCFDRLLALKPGAVEVLNNRGNALWQLRRAAEALASFDAALAIDPDSALIHNNRGNTLLDLNRPADALASFERALALKPDYADALVNRANALRDLNRSREAIASCDAALALNPDMADAHWNKGLEQLLLGDFANGWPNYEWRWRRAGADTRDFSAPQWRGEALAGKTILLHAEQGFGDSIQFLRYLPLVAAKGARIILELPDSLMPLLGSRDGVAAIVSRGQSLPPFDLHCPLMSLPLAFGTTLATIPAAVPYLQAPPERVAAWRAQLPRNAVPRVGLVWSGKPSHRNDHNRSLAFARLAPLLAQANVEFVSLQRDVRDTDKAALENAAILRPDFADFADTAAVIETLDLVVAVDTAVAHLAGALAKPLWLLLPFCPDWRWMLDRADCPWYPSARLFRQPRPGDWDSVIKGLCEALASLTATRHTPAQ